MKTNISAKMFSKSSASELLYVVKGYQTMYLYCFLVVHQGFGDRALLTLLTIYNLYAADDFENNPVQI